MVDRQSHQDAPALLTRVTRRQATRSDAIGSSSSIETTPISAATIIKRPLKVVNQSETPIQIENSKKLKLVDALPLTTEQNLTLESDENAIAKKYESDLPTFEEYEALKIGRSPYFCVVCEKSFSRSSINSHVKSKHKGKTTKVNCLFCHKKFDRHTKAQDHVASDHKVYSCNKDNCTETFSEFERLKSHLKSSHNKSDWPWICGFCDQVLFYNIEFQVHIKKHTEPAPFACPKCDDSFTDTSKACDHLAERHLPRKVENGIKPEPEKPKKSKFKDTLVEKETSCQQKEDLDEGPDRENLKQNVLEALVRFRRKSEGLVSPNSGSCDKMKDENAVNREIAALLLNLHASRGAPKPEDLSLKTSPANNDSAMDLTKTKTSAATITKLVKSSQSGVDLSSAKNNKSSAQVVSNNSAAVSQNIPNFSLPTAPTSYPFYSSLATMAGMTPSLAMNSNYLLQNLLLGKMQQIVSASSGSTPVVTAKTSASSVATLSVPATSLPTQPLPAQSLSLPATNVSLKPPPAVFKTTTVPHSGAGNNAPSFTNPMTLTSGVGGETTTTTVTAATAASIPLLCGQIVSQLNGLLFLVHGISNATLELNLQTQLTAIHSRLQDIVTMVEHAKKSDPELNGEKVSKEVKQKDEEKIVAKHIQEYQRALLKQHDDKNGKNLIVELPDGSPNESMELQEAESTSSYLSAAARRRRGRPPKNSNLDLSYSPPEKQMKTTSAANGENPDHSVAHNGESHGGATNGNGSQLQHHQNGSSSNTNGSIIQAVAAASKGSKGIRNRVFCGECVGCLKNDDCGKCRYCKDKTKFGGQNRLRQKCLHRRCQMDTHRRRSSHNGQSSGPNATNAAASMGDNSDAFESSASDIYSGVDLARLAAAGQQHQLAAVAMAAAAAKQTLAELDSLEPQNLAVNQDLMKNGSDRSGSSASNGSDEDCDDVKTGKTQSRIDKWKAKHEAMLKLAQKTEKSDSKLEQGDNGGKKISSEDKKDEILSLDPSAGVCIDFDQKDIASKLANGRHSMPPQVLSV